MIRQKLRTLEALFLLLAYAIAIRLAPVRRVLPADQATAEGPARHFQSGALAVRGAIRSASARSPVKPSCLVQSLAAATMLRRRGVPHRFHIGARQEPAFEAHAWVEAGGLVIAGEGDIGGYSVMLSRGR